MCMDRSITCKCGKHAASFNFKNEIMPPETVEALYCPECSGAVQHDPASMIRDNGWVIHYDMDVAALYGGRLPANDMEKLSPAVLFDEGYITWRGVYPGDHIGSVSEREELAKLAKENPRQYFEEMRTWAVGRMTRLREEGWRKAHEG